MLTRANGVSIESFAERTRSESHNRLTMKGDFAPRGRPGSEIRYILWLGRLRQPQLRSRRDGQGEFGSEARRAWTIAGVPGSSGSSTGNTSSWSNSWANSSGTTTSTRTSSFWWRRADSGWILRPSRVDRRGRGSIIGAAHGRTSPSGSRRGPTSCSSSRSRRSIPETSETRRQSTLPVGSDPGRDRGNVPRVDQLFSRQ